MYDISSSRMQEAFNVSDWPGAEPPQKERIRVMTDETACSRSQLHAASMVVRVLRIAGLTLLASCAMPAQAALDCWLPTRNQTQPRYLKQSLPALLSAAREAERVVRDNPHFKAMPRPIRIRPTVAVTPGTVQLNVNAYRPEVWEGTCGLSAGADRCCSDGGITILVNQPRNLLKPFDKDAAVEIFEAPRRTGHVAGYPEYGGMYVVLTPGEREPWLPLTVAEYLDFVERRLQRQAAEAEANLAAARGGIDPAEVQRAYEGMKKIDPKAAEAFRTDMEKRMAATPPARAAVRESWEHKQLAELRALRAQLTPAQSAAPAYMGAGPMNLGVADDARSRSLVKLDPSFPDPAAPDRVQLISVFVSVVPNDAVAERRATMQRTKDTLDYAALAKLLR